MCVILESAAGVTPEALYGGSNPGVSIPFVAEKVSDYQERLP
jgi:hypothetical protein